MESPINEKEVCEKVQMRVCRNLAGTCLHVSCKILDCPHHVRFPKSVLPEGVDE